MSLPKKILYTVGGGMALVVVGVFIGMSFKGEKINQPAGQTAAVSNANQSSETNINQFAPTTPPRKLGTPPLAGGEEEVKVVRVVDGDTIQVEINGKMEPVRYIGIDTPETVDPRKTVQCFGVEASKKNKELVEGKMVRLEKDITNRDKYNRLLRYVYLKPQINADTETQMNADSPGEIFVNLALVEQGFAKSYSYPPDVKYQDLFVAAERHAREDKLGLWTACVSATPAVSAMSTAAASASASNPSCTIKGNIGASGEKIYHLQGCGSYAKTTIDEKRGEQWFCTEAEAQTGGWRKALNCP